MATKTKDETYDFSIFKTDDDPREVVFGTDDDGVTAQLPNGQTLTRRTREDAEKDAFGRMIRLYGDPRTS